MPTPASKRPDTRSTDSTKDDDTAAPPTRRSGRLQRDGFDVDSWEPSLLDRLRRLNDRRGHD